MSESAPGEGTVWRTSDDDNSLTPHDRLLKHLRTTARERFWDEFDRESYACPVCGRSDVPMDVHHRDGDPYNNHPMNLIGVCSRCHRMEHRRRGTVKGVSEWKESVPGSR